MPTLFRQAYGRALCDRGIPDAEQAPGNCVGAVFAT
jgi:hypothetical protein